MKLSFCFLVIGAIVFITSFVYKKPVSNQFCNATTMAKHFQPFSFLILGLVLALIPTLQGSRRILLAVTPAPSPHLHFAPGSAPSEGPASVPIPSQPPEQPPPVVPPPSTGGGGVVPQRNSVGGSSGLSGGQKAGITIGVLAAAGLIGFATVVYMKRRSNIRRARFGASARRSQL